MQRRTTRFPGQEVHTFIFIFIFIYTPILFKTQTQRKARRASEKLEMRGVWQMLLPDRKTGFKRYGMISRAVY